MIKKFRDLSIQTKLAIEISFLVVLIAAFLLWYFPQRQKEITMKGLEDKAIRLAEMMAYNASAGVEFEDSDSVQAVLKSIKDDSDIVYAKVVKADGTLLSSFEPKGQSGTTILEIPTETKIFNQEKDGLLKIVTPVMAGGSRVANLQLGFSLERINAELARSEKAMMVICLGILVIGIFFGLFIGGIVAKPMRETIKVLEAIAAGDLSQEFSLNVDSSSKDEVGRMAHALKQAAEGMRNIRSVVQAMAQSAQTMANASDELTSVNQQMSSNAEETSAQANLVSTSAGQVSKNIQTVATAVEQMNSSIKEIARNANKAATVATSAVKVAGSTNQTITRLSESSGEIGNIVRVINSIAEQTNLLALNASIEAVRAGDAGKGFAVVANEVKELAKETAKATDDISGKIKIIQTDANSAVGAIGEISKIINSIHDIQNTTASAVEEQTATTGEIGRSVGKVAKNSTEIAENIANVAEAAKSTTKFASKMQKSASEFTHLADDLRKKVGQFKY